MNILSGRHPVRLLHKPVILKSERLVPVRPEAVPPQRRVGREVGEQQPAQAARDVPRVQRLVGAAHHQHARHQRAARLAAARHHHHRQRPDRGLHLRYPLLHSGSLRR